MSQQLIELLSLMARSNGAQPVQTEPAVEEGEELVIEFTMVAAAEVYSVDDREMGVKSVLRRAPSWLLNLHGKQVFPVQVGDNEWQVQVGGNRKTYASAREGKQRLYIDTSRQPQPGFRRTSKRKYVPLDGMPALMAAVNQELPRWKQLLGDSALQRTDFKNARLEIGDNAPLQILHSKRGSPLGDFLKTKLSSVPSWLLQGKVRAPFYLDGECWWIKCNKTMKMHVSQTQRRITINPNNSPGRTRDVESSLLLRLCDAFNAQQAESRINAERYIKQRAIFRAADDCIQGNSVKAVCLQKTELLIRLTEAPKWLQECNEVFYVQVENQVWECGWNDSHPCCDGANMVLLLNNTIKGVNCSESTLVRVLDAINSALPNWQAALQASAKQEREKRREALDRYGPIKRRYIDVHLAVDALSQISESI